jgi:hypothetical protein
LFRRQWLTLVILATWEAEIGRIKVRGQRGQKVREAPPISKVTRTKQNGGVAQGVERLLCKFEAQNRTAESVTSLLNDVHCITLMQRKVMSPKQPPLFNLSNQQFKKKQTKHSQDWGDDEKTGRPVPPGEGIKCLCPLRDDPLHLGIYPEVTQRYASKNVHFNIL